MGGSHSTEVAARRRRMEGRVGGGEGTAPLAWPAIVGGRISCFRRVSGKTDIRMVFWIKFVELCWL